MMEVTSLELEGCRRLEVHLTGGYPRHLLSPSCGAASSQQHPHYDKVSLGSTLILHRMSWMMQRNPAACAAPSIPAEGL